MGRVAIYGVEIYFNRFDTRIRVLHNSHTIDNSKKSLIFFCVHSFSRNSVYFFFTFKFVCTLPMRTLALVAAVHRKQVEYLIAPLFVYVGMYRNMFRDDFQIRTRCEDTNYPGPYLKTEELAISNIRKIPWQNIPAYIGRLVEKNI